jgi:hypothetical protein
MQVMVGFRSLCRHWQIEHHEAQRCHEEERLLRFRAVLGAYGYDLYPQAEPSSLNDSLLVARLAATDSLESADVQGVPAGESGPHPNGPRQDVMRTGA